MSDVDPSLRRKHQILVEKYKALRRNHKRLAGVALELVEALEDFVKDEKAPDVSRILLSCSRIYPGLVEAGKGEGAGGNVDGTQQLANERETGSGLIAAEGEAEDGTGTEEVNAEDRSREEYSDGFWSRPKIPRTPQV